jgi:hypothetical protein
VTPVLKAAWTEQAFHGGSDCLQVFGGHGYIREWGIEQNVRDARVAMIYEGTNEIQAIDLLIRKVLADQGQSMAALLDELAAGLPAPQGLASGVPALLAQIRGLTAALVAAHQSSPQLAYWIAPDYLRLVALALLAWAWAVIGAVPAPKASEDRWAQAGMALTHWVLPEFGMRAQLIGQQLANAGAPQALTAEPA